MMDEAYIWMNPCATEPTLLIFNFLFLMLNCIRQRDSSKWRVVAADANLSAFPCYILHSYAETLAFASTR